MKKLLWVLCSAACLSGMASPIFEVGSVPNPTAVHIQRTMKTLEESTAEKPATVRVLFYGQSIVRQGWTQILMKMLKEKYPTVNFVWENRAIGGFTSPSLTYTAWSDLFPFYPDLLFFHVYGPMDKYEEIIRNTRAMTAAEIVVWSSHLSAKQDPAAMLKTRDKRTLDIRAVAERNGCMFVDLNKKWCEMLLANHLSPTNLLSDGIHMNAKTDALKYYAGFIGEELRRMPQASPEPEVSGTIVEIPAVPGKHVKRLKDGTLRLTFTGNRVVAVSDGAAYNPAKGARQATGELYLDGRPVSSYKEMWYATRPSTLVSWMPMIKRVSFDALPVKETWKLTYLEGTDPWGKNVRFKVSGSVTGDDGEGWSTNAFVSTSGRAVIDKNAYFFAWQYDYFVKRHAKTKPEVLKKQAKPGDQITWQTLPLYADPYKAAPKGTRSVLVQNCSNARHVLEIRPGKDGRLPGIASFIVYAPAR